MPVKRDVQRKVGWIVTTVLGIGSLFGCDVLLKNSHTTAAELKKGVQHVAQFVHHGHAPEATLSQLYVELENARRALQRQNVSGARAALVKCGDCLDRLLSTRRMGCACFGKSDPVVKRIVALIDAYVQEIDDLVESEAFFDAESKKFWSVVHAQPKWGDFEKKVDVFSFGFSAAVKQLLQPLKNMQNKYPKHPEWAVNYLENLGDKSFPEMVDQLASNWLTPLYARRRITKAQYVQIMKEVDAAKKAAREVGFLIDHVIDPKLKNVFYHVAVKE